MSLHIYEFGQRVVILSGTYKGQTGTVFAYLPVLANKYIIKIRHEGFPENHYHHVRVRSNNLKEVER
ncbi:MAG: hypothetical protein PHU54_08440 [Candidatus Omnitrophica bacterium]|jgi:hypothetical protein|nr:hypothetical protein [Candidatus Omnitrophota bacterium]